MAYTPQTIKAWITENPKYQDFLGTVSGTPLAYQFATPGAPKLTAETWFAFDWVTGLPDTSQAPTTADISPTGAINRILLNTVPDAPSPSDLTVNVGADTDKCIDAMEGLMAEKATAYAAGKKMYLMVFLGANKKSKIFEADVYWSGAILGDFPDPYTTNLSITPNLGGYDKFQVITNVGG